MVKTFVRIDEIRECDFTMFIEDGEPQSWIEINTKYVVSLEEMR